ncbi:MAG: hypothetical protein OEY68_10205, partial [Gammaproteobacteria bacterium]|nr:hypothetical protein [Gammaproteobacteria bacterium]
LTGAGKLDLVKEWVSYKAEATLSKDLKTENIKIKELDKILGKPIPVNIDCSLKAINASCFKYSLEEIIKQEIENKIKDQIFKKLVKPKTPAPTEPVAAEQPAQEPTADPKKQLEQDLKKKLLEGLFR